jgi:hypothetical protein
MVLEDIDFENFKIEETRAQSLRALIDKVKAGNIIADVKVLLNELGQDESASTTQAGDNLFLQIPGINSETSARVFRTLDTETNTQWVFVDQNSEIFVHSNQTPVLEGVALPKGNEYALMYVNESLIESFASFWEAGLKVKIKEAKQLKSARAAAFKSRFEQSTPETL